MDGKPTSKPWTVAKNTLWPNQAPKIYKKVGKHKKVRKREAKELPWNVGIVSNVVIIKEPIKLLITPTRRLIKRKSKGNQQSSTSRAKGSK